MKIRDAIQEVESDITAFVISYDEYKTDVELFDNYMETYFSSIQGKKWYWTLFVNFYETALIAAWEINYSIQQKILNFWNIGELLE